MSASELRRGSDKVPGPCDELLCAFGELLGG